MFFYYINISDGGFFDDFPKISEDDRRLPKTVEEDPKKFR